MSEITTRSVESQTKMRAVAATAPEADNENVIELGPGFKLSDFYGNILNTRTRIDRHMHSQVDQTSISGFWRIFSERVGQL